MFKAKTIMRHLARPAVTLGMFVALELVLSPFPQKASPGATWDRLESVASLGQEGREILTIYSVFKLNRADLNEADAWDIARTIFHESTAKALDPMLVLAVIKVESEFRSEAVSHRGARGLMQVMPIVVDHLVQTTDFRLSEEVGSFHPHALHDPILNIRLGVSYLTELRKQFRDLRLALTAYNWGPTEIQRKLNENEPIPFDYAGKVLAAYESFRRANPAAKRASKTA